MDIVLGEGYSRSWAADFHLDTLDGRTAERALADGESALRVWRAVGQTIDVPANLR
jgi:hypothetical protein